MKHIRAAIELAKEMIRMADHAGNTCDDDGCLVVYGVIKDCAYKIKESAQRALQASEERDA